MSLPILHTCNNIKKAPKLFDLSTFCDPGSPIRPIEAFRDNIRMFLRECAVVEDYTVDSMPVWCTLLVQENKGVIVPVYTLEESVKFSKQPFCDQCRCTGWSHHYMSKRKYHIIIQVDSDWNKPLSSNVLEDQTHLLHGLIHCNGFGHLLGINGIEGGSKYLCGREIMGLWDRICTNLHARMISVEDTSRKRSMDLRLLHGIAYGHSWFGKWGYKFGHGSFGVKAYHYERAVEILSSLDLDDLLWEHNKENSDIQRIISSYRDLSNTRLITLRDLFRFMLSLKSKVLAQTKIPVLSQKSETPVKTKVALTENSMHLPLRKITLRNRYFSAKAKPTKLRKFSSVVATMDSRWPKRRLEYTAEVIVRTLKEHKEIRISTNGGMTRQEVRDAARVHIGDTGLLDYVLKSMTNVIVGKYIVRRRTNPVNRVLEYTIHEAGETQTLIGVEDSEPASSVRSVPVKSDLVISDRSVPEKSKHVLSVRSVRAPVAASGSDVYTDISALYKQLLLDHPPSDIVDLSVGVIIDSKHFVKEWPFHDENDLLLRFICRVLPTSSKLDMELYRKMSPGELIVLPLHASFGDLRAEAQHALRDTYCIMEHYEVDDIESLDILEDDEAVFGAIESGSEPWVRGSGIDLNTEFRYEGGPDNWIVKCSCGTKDDDGERMVSCDICEVWQHTRCSGIEDSDAVPPIFVCQGCCSSLMPPRAETMYSVESSHHMMLQPELGRTWLAVQ